MNLRFGSRERLSTTVSMMKKTSFAKYWSTVTCHPVSSWECGTRWTLIFPGTGPPLVLYVRDAGNGYGGGPRDAGSLCFHSAIVGVSSPSLPEAEIASSSGASPAIR